MLYLQIDIRKNITKNERDVVDMVIDYKIIGKRIKAERAKHKFTQEEMAEKIECSTRYISDIEQDRSKPSYEVLIRICNSFNIGINEIFSEYLKITGNREENLSLVGFNKLSEKNKETIIHLIEYFNK